MDKVFVSWPGYDPADPETGQRLADAGYAVVLEPKLGARNEQELAGLLDGAVAAIVSTDPFTRRVIGANPQLRIISRVGVGTDSIDANAAADHGVAISITPGMNAETVADHTLALLLALIRKVVDQDQTVKAGGWERIGPRTPSELNDKTVGLVGAGIIGQAVARRLRGFGAHIVFVDAAVDAVAGAEKLDTFDRLLEISDIVSLHAPLSAATSGLIGAAALRRMKSTALLVNTARGQLVDQGALFEALHRGEIAGAGLDVFAEEPPDSNMLAGVPNLVCSAHIGGISRESVRRMTISATDSVLAVLAGNVPETVINPLVLQGRDGRAR